jgi:hypothetical protein
MTPFRFPSAVGTDCSLTLTGPKREVVGQYISRLGPELRKRYGKQTHYTPDQVRTTAADQGLAVDYLCFAYCLYCSPADFSALHSGAAEVCEYWAMRALVGETFFPGATDLVLSADGPAEAFGGVADVLAGVASAVPDADLIGGLVDGVGAVLAGLLDAIGSASP